MHFSVQRTHLQLYYIDTCVNCTRVSSLCMVVRLFLPKRAQVGITIHSFCTMQQRLRRSTCLAAQSNEKQGAPDAEPTPSPNKRPRKRAASRGQENKAQAPRLKRSATRVTGAFGSFEEELWKQYARVVGIDEAGRGPLAGTQWALREWSTANLVAQVLLWQQHAVSQKDGHYLEWMIARP